MKLDRIMIDAAALRGELRDVLIADIGVICCSRLRGRSPSCASSKMPRVDRRVGEV